MARERADGRGERVVFSERQHGRTHVRLGLAFRQRGRRRGDDHDREDRPWRRTSINVRTWKSSGLGAAERGGREQSACCETAAGRRGT